MHNQSDPDVPKAVRASGSPDPDDLRDPLDPVADPSVMDVVPGSGQRAAEADEVVPEASDESFPASDPPTWTGSASTPDDREREEPAGDTAAERQSPS